MSDRDQPFDYMSPAPAPPSLVHILHGRVAGRQCGLNLRFVIAPRRVLIMVIVGLTAVMKGESDNFSSERLIFRNQGASFPPLAPKL